MCAYSIIKAHNEYEHSDVCVCVCYPLPALLLSNLNQGNSFTLLDVACHSGELVNTVESVGTRLVSSAFGALFIVNDRGRKIGLFGSSSVSTLESVIRSELKRVSPKCRQFSPFSSSEPPTSSCLKCLTYVSLCIWKGWRKSWAWARGALGVELLFPATRR